jgi:hypothetical protein
MDRIRTPLLVASLVLAIICCLMPWAPGNFANHHLGTFYLIWIASVIACLVVRGKYAKLSLLGIPVALFPVFLIFIGGLISHDWP